MKKIIFVFTIGIIGQLCAQNVDQFTGSFSYGQSLFLVPSNRGTPVSIDASYQAGIQVNQAASEIGLGWNLSAGGAIYRSVSGLPDDLTTLNTLSLPNGELTTNGRGALYPSYASGSAYEEDLVTLKRGLDTADFMYPDFDIYNVTGSGPGGKIQPSYFKYYSYDYNLITSKYAPNVSPNSNIPYRKPQFHFTGDFADTLVSRHYPTSPITNATPFNFPADAISGLGYPSSPQPFIGKHLNGSTISNENFDMTTGRLATSNFIEYFTNAEIDAAPSFGFSAIDNQNTFIDYTVNHSRPPSSFPSEGIGCFRITTATGLTYHYSLPVYELESTLYSFPLAQDYSLLPGITLANLPTTSGYEYIKHPLNDNIFIKSQNSNKIAVKWLLTAITGSDFVDNGNHIIDDQDQGYWVAYDYQLWSSQFTTRNPAYGYDIEFNPDPKTQKYPTYFPIASTFVAPPSYYSPYKLSGLYGSINIIKRQVYHLSKIRTSSHTAIFVRDIRADEKGGDAATTSLASFKPSPDLLLKRIILFKNEQLDSILLAQPLTAFNAVNYPQFDFTTINNSTANFFTEDWYQQKYNSFYFCILKQVLFDQDYSLCRKYHNNINVSYTGSTLFNSPNDVEANLSTNNYSSSGKLTLNRILEYELKNEKVAPSTIFDYNYNNSPGLSNPDYNPKKVDYWGYYKSDATQNSYSRYTTSSSKNLTKAWSLLKITNPLGGVTEMDYESNSYNRVIDNEVAGGVRGAAFIYRIQKADVVGAGFDVTLEEGNGAQNSLTEFLNLTPQNIPGLKTKICVPYFQSTCFNDPACVDYISVGTSCNKGFIFGDCTYNTNVVANNPYNLTGNIPIPANNIRNAFTFLDNEIYQGTSGMGSTTSNAPSCDPLNQAGFYHAYSGNGFVMCETPIGYEVYGNGIRVKRITTRNNVLEAYVTDYTYEDGVATNEMDRFSYQIPKRIQLPSPARYDFLQPKSFGLFDLQPYVGYSKVTVKNLGRINSDNGKTETTYLTLPASENGVFSQNYAINTIANNNVFYTSWSKVINECVNVFSNVFGKIKESKVFDKNNNILSRKVFEYEPTQQGALTENFHFQKANYLNVSYYYLHTSNILREVPVVLKRTTLYDMGAVKKTETLVRDELTGTATVRRSYGENSSSSMAYQIPAYKYYLPLEGGLNLTSAVSRIKIPFTENCYRYSTVDSLLTPTQVNGNSASFLDASFNLYSKVIRQRQYSTSTGLFTNNQLTLPYYAHNRSFTFDAGDGSMDVYGLYAKSNLNLNPLNLNTINSSVFWEPGSITYNWKLLYEHTLIDSYKNLVETRDANNRFNAVRFGYNGYYQTASASNCNYASFTFADFENPAPNTGNATIDGDMLVNNHTFVNYATLVPHTGVRCIQVSSTPVSFLSASELSPGGSMEIGLQSGRMYRASVWVHNTNLTNARLQITLNGLVNVTTPYALNNIITATPATHLVTTMGSWNLLQVDFEVPEKFVSGVGTPLKIELKSANSGIVYFDDFIFHPVESNFTAKVYNTRNGRVTSTLDGNGLTTNYIYDAMGRTTEIWKEIPGSGYKRIKSNTYNYARGANN